MNRSRIHISVVSVNDARAAYMTQMFADLKLPYSFSVHRGVTPADMRGFVINDTHAVYPEPPNVICCTRTHLGAIHEFATSVWRDKDILIVMEDDVTLLRDTFEAELDRVIALWDKHDADIDYVSIGYLAKSEGENYTYGQSDGCLRWDTFIRGGSVWGAQAYMMRRPVAERISRELYSQTTTRDLRNVLDALRRPINQGLGYSYKSLRLQADGLFNAFLRQAFVYPMLAMESVNFVSTITGVENDHRKQDNDVILGRPCGDFYMPRRGVETKLDV
jgi:GR25 family glycosyltransferase involved in LPS biosynthesis